MINKIADFKSLMIKIASPEDIKNWSYGEVTKPETINYRTLRPEKDGLFCERIFGPTKDWECYCGKYKRIRYRGIVCDKCGVEVTLSRVRRERMGHITLASPVAHVWFFRGSPSRMSLLLDIPPKSLEAVVYFAQYLVTDVDATKRKDAIDALTENYQKREQEIKKGTDEKREALKKEFQKDKEALKDKIKNKEALLLAEKEQDLSSKQKEKWLEDKVNLEFEKLNTELTLLQDKIKSIKKLSTLSEEDYFRLKENGAAGFFKVGMGTESILEVIKKLDLKKMADELKEEAQKSTGQRYIKAIKRLRVAEGMVRSKQDPAWMILTVLPVIPPDLRPMVQLTGGRFASSDLNDLYRRVINRNNRLKHLIELGAPEIILRNEKRMLQEAVDSLLDSNKSIREKKSRKTQVLRSLSDMLRGKQGRFRQNLLGKRVDYSGRSVIVVGPELNLRQCGLPKEMALEMFKPFVLREMIVRGVAPNVKSAKNILERRPAEVFDILEEITKDHPVLLNRAPTLHKLGIQAFFPILIEGNALRIHPCICQGFNADFDGDQMAVHVPLSKKAQEEAVALMTPDNNMLRPADGTPINTPDRKEIALGIYYLTCVDPVLKLKDKAYSREEALCAFQTGNLKLREPIKVQVQEAGGIIETTVGRLMFNEVLPEALRFINTGVKQGTIKELFTKAMKICSHEEVLALVDSLKDLGFYAGTVSGISLSINDCVMTPQKSAIIKVSDDKVAEIGETYKQGLITLDEEKRLIREVWMETTEDLADKTWEIIDETNPIKLIIDAKVGRVSRDTIKQISAMRGLVVDPTGKIVDLPTKSNFREGLSVFEFVTTTRGSRKGLTDSALKTSDAGYLTRKLVDVSHEAIIRADDCGTEEGIEISRKGNRGNLFSLRVLGRVLAKPVIDPKTKKVLFKKGELLDELTTKQLEESGVESVVVRSPLTCQTRFGLCAKCYGWDFSNKKMVEVGVPVGVIAAQSIGEPGTQLTLQTRHRAGVVGLDVTQGLPRVTELFEVRMPKVVSPLAEISGKVEIVTEDNGYRIIISEEKKDGEKREYLVPLTSTLQVNDGEKVLAGTQLASGALDIREILSVRGLREAQRYLIDEIQAVYESQGIPINDRHIETVVRMMSETVKVKTAGDTSFLSGELVNRLKLEEENSRTKNKQAVAEQIILGITRAALHTESWLSAASFQETSNILADAAIMGKEDKLLGLKENVIIGRLIPTSPERARMES